MQYTILLDSNKDAKEVAEKERARFTKTIIDCLEIPVEYNPDNYADIDERIKLRQSLHKYHIAIIEDFDGGSQIYLKNDLIAEWKKCKFKLKEDITEKDPKKKLYYEMIVSFWSIYEDTHNGEKTTPK